MNMIGEKADGDRKQMDESRGWLQLLTLVFIPETLESLSRCLVLEIWLFIVVEHALQVV